MKTLTERQLACYVGTGVQVKFENSNATYIYKIGGQEDDYTLDLMRNWKGCKLLLRPNADLTKEITHNGETFVPMYRLLETYCKMNQYGFDILYTNIDTGHNHVVVYDSDTKHRVSIDLGSMERSAYWILNQLHEWHFACGLDEGLWIDLNTITKETE